MSNSKAKNLQKTKNFGNSTKKRRNFGSIKKNKQNSSKKRINAQKKFKKAKETLLSDVKLNMETGKTDQQPQTVDSQQVEVKKPKKDQFFLLKQKINSSNDGDKQEAIELIEKGLKAIESRKELTKTAKRKMRQLKKIKKSAEGEVTPVPSKNINAKSKSTKRRERRIAAAKQKAENEIKTETCNEMEKK